jgi:hypothetical protein
MNPSELRPGDVIDHRWPDVHVTVLREAEMHQDIFGRPLLRVWSRREDTGAEGYMSYGPDAEVATVNR